MWPLVKLAELLTKLLGSDKHKPLIRREEFIALTRVGTQEGVLIENEYRILKNLFRFDQLCAADIMTPRTVIFALSENLTVSEVVKSYPELRFSRIPIYTKNLDEVAAFALKSDILQNAVQGKGQSKLKELRRPLLVISQDLALHELFEKLINESAHIALVIDNYGGTVGLVTLEDLMETLVGLEIVDETDSVKDMQKFARERWLKRARRFGIVTDNGRKKYE
jgi:CBS domain containing-hemolysin-like protein